jgi:hypothetical protein
LPPQQATHSNAIEVLNRLISGYEGTWLQKKELWLGQQALPPALADVLVDTTRLVITGKMRKADGSLGDITLRGVEFLIDGPADRPTTTTVISAQVALYSAYVVQMYQQIQTQITTERLKSWDQKTIGCGGAAVLKEGQPHRWRGDGCCTKCAARKHHMCIKTTGSRNIVMPVRVKGQVREGGGIHLLKHWVLSCTDE